MKLKVIICIVSILAVSLLSVGLPSVSASAILTTPIGTTMTVLPNETFILTFKIRFDEANDGYFVTTFYWDNNETDPAAPYWNFTYEGFKCWFTDGTNFSGPINVTFLVKVPSDYPAGYYRYVVGISESYGETKNGDFWVNITMRAAGLMNSSYFPHAEGDQNILMTVRCAESGILSKSGACIIHVGTSPPPPSEPIIIDTPVNDIITVVSGETFILSFKMKFNETENGFFVIAFYWDNNQTDLSAPYWNFTYEDFVCRFTDGTNFSGPINVTFLVKVPSDYPAGYYRYMVGISESYGETKNGDFWVNVTMRAAGVMNTVYYPHAEGDQNITISTVCCSEATIEDQSFGNCSIHIISLEAPEFHTWTSMLLILIMLTVAIAIYKRRPFKTSIH